MTEQTFDQQARDRYAPAHRPGPFDYWSVIARNGKADYKSAEVAGLGAGPDLLAGRIVVTGRDVAGDCGPCYTGQFMTADDGTRIVLSWSQSPEPKETRTTARKSAPKRDIVERPSTVADVARRMVAERQAAGRVNDYSVLASE